MDDRFDATMEMIVAAIKQAGYDPYAQLTGFLRTRDDRYITRTGNARELIGTLDRSRLKHYVKHMK